MDNEKKVKVTAGKIAFLMSHQEVLPDLLELAQDLRPSEENINKNSPEYLLGAYEALQFLITTLQRKGCKI
jgi:hypothetical protein